MIASRALALFVSLSALGFNAACNGASPSTESASTTQAVEARASASEPGVEAREPSKGAPARPAGPRGTPQPRLPIGTIEFEAPAPRAPLTVKVEVADTDEQRRLGLMFREELGELEGMLFLFPTERQNNFWMHNTLLPLDMFFIDSDWKVVGVVENAEPLTDTSRGVGKMSRYVLEVNAGFAKRHGFGEGQQVRFVAPGEKP